MSFCIFLYLRGKVYFPIPWIQAGFVIYFGQLNVADVMTC